MIIATPEALRFSRLPGAARDLGDFRCLSAENFASNGIDFTP
jgi:hypothetical protein